ncbi:MAG: hypothetical protein KW788_00965 [Candidatus Doudnabacteria bacterium]|nr:hypothetical protein [Candidatus Doudnabacteria bacterium]
MPKKQKTLQHSFQVRFSEKTMAQIMELQEHYGAITIAETIRRAVEERHKVMEKQTKGFSVFGKRDSETIEFLL